MNRFDGVYLYTDIDGTLLNDAHRVPEINRAMISRFISEGGRFGIATGRTVQSLHDHLDGLALSAPCILANGAAVYDFERGEYVFYDYLDKPAAAEIVHGIMSVLPQISIQIWTLDGAFTPVVGQVPDPIAALEALRCPMRPMEEVTDGWLKIVLSYEQAQMFEALERIGYKRYLDRFSFAHSGDIYAEFLPIGVTKGSALSRIRALPQMQHARVLAIGDYFNDITLLEEADVSAAPANAPGEVKRYANELVCSNNEGAVGDFLRRTLFMDDQKEIST